MSVVQKDNNVCKITKNKKNGFFGRILEKIDKIMEEKSKKISCCSGSDKNKDSSCC